MGKERKKGGTEKRLEETFGGYVTILITVMISQVYTCQNLRNHTLLMCTVYYMPIIFQ